MKRLLIAILLTAALVLPAKSHAQYDRNYIYWVGQQCMVKNNYREAIDLLNVLLRHDPKDFDAHFLRGIAKYNMDDLLGADSDFSKAVELNPVFTGAFYYRAITRSRLGNYDDALNDFQQAIELRPDLPDPYYSRGVTRLLNQQFEEAIADFNKFIRFDWAAKRILRDKANFGVLEGLLTVLLEEQVTIVELLESESNQDAPEDKFNRVDIKAKNSRGEIIIVEVQLTRELYYLERILYGVSKAVIEHISLGDKYDQVKKVYSINILYFDLGQGKDYLYHGQKRLHLHSNF